MAKTKRSLLTRSNQILGKEWCEMLFEDRNTEYGAYELRRQTGHRYGKSLGCLGMLLAAIVTPIVVLMIIFAEPVHIYDIGDEITRFEGVRIKEAKPQRRTEKKSAPEMTEKAQPQIEDVDPIADMLTVKQEEPVEPDKIEDPPAAVRQKVQGTVTVAFIVEPDGSTKDVRIVKGANKMLNGEALRVMALMQQWRPARKYGRPIRSQVTLPIVFAIE